MNNTDMISVTNRTRNLVVYNVPDLRIRREFQAGEVKSISFEELQRLSWTPGGLYLLKNSLRIDSREALEELGIQCEMEYYYSVEDVKNLLEKGSEDELLDCLDFAPDGVVELVKDFAIKTELNDMRKREIIRRKTGLDITKAIEINRESGAAEVEQPQARRVSVGTAARNNTSEGGATRRVTPQFKVNQK